MDNQQNKTIVPTIADVTKQWDSLSDVYSDFDSAPQGFYFTLIHALQLGEAKNILEIGCGRCLIVPYTLELKKPEASYLASDLTPKMVQLAEERMRKGFEAYESKLTF